MSTTNGFDRRQGALERAMAHAPFLRAAADAQAELVAQFLQNGAESALEHVFSFEEEVLAAGLRRQRLGLALAVALGDLAGELSLEQVTRYLSDFQDRAIDEALAAVIRERVPDAETTGFAILALGKLGSRELNYSSDVDLVFLFDPVTLARRERDDAMEVAVRYAHRLVSFLQDRTAEGYVARVDLRLRPSPEVTPIALPVDASISYYESQALPWERAAFIRARAVAGDLRLGERFLEEIKPFIWRRALDFGAIEEIREITSRTQDHYTQGLNLGPGYDLKRGRGGIREIEFFTQVFQLIHGGRDPGLQTSAILEALPALGEAGHLSAETVAQLSSAYRRLRTVEHRIQMVDDQQTHRLPAQPDALDSLARLDGLESGTDLIETLVEPVAHATAAFDSMAGERRDKLPDSPERLQSALADLGFEDSQSAARLVGSWRSGHVRSLRSPAARNAFEAMLPILLAEIAKGPDPAHALNRFSDVVEKLSSGINLFRLLEAKPRLAEQVSLILAHAPALADQLSRRPELLDGLVDGSCLNAPPEPAAFAAILVSGPPDEPYDAMLDRVRLVVGERRFGLGVQLIDKHRDPLDLAIGYANIAEGAIVALTDAATSEFAKLHGRIDGGELIVLALGRLGGRALTHASDLDLIFLYDAPPDAISDGNKPLGPADYYNRLAKRIVAALGVPTAAGPLYEVDTRLRPQGEQGMLAVHVDTFAAYQRDEAWTWEHMALLRARPLTGSPSAKARLVEIIKDVLSIERDPEKIRADAAKMRDDIASHKPPAGPLDIKLGPGGLVDLEFAVHTLQLTHGIGFDPRLEYAMQELAEAGLIDPIADSDLRLLSRVLVTTRLVAPGGGEPQPESRHLVAEVCGMSSWDELIEAHDAARTRILGRWNDIKGEEG